MRALILRNAKALVKNGNVFPVKNAGKPTALSAPWFHSQPANLNKQDIAIIGGGIASLCTAISLVKRGLKSQFIAKLSKLPSMHLAINKALLSATE